MLQAIGAEASRLAPTPTPTFDLDRRQLWNFPTATSTTTVCPQITLASGGVLVLNPTSTITFTTNLLYRPNCTSSDSDSTIDDHHDPFFASTTVLIYVVATATVTAWFLFTLLLVAPGKTVPRSATRGSAWLPGGGMTGAISASQSVLSSSARPWLQKAAAFLVTIGLTIASVDTFKVAHKQYRSGYMDATAMRDAVVGNLAIRILRVISDIFIWLAQVQTLIRLFPRRKEKLIIKWFGFLLILLDSVFSCLNSFYINSREYPRTNQDAIPALSYLFQLSISLFYGAWVFYYVATKRRYAFISNDMPSITIVMMLAIVSILIPVGFFVADVSVPAVSGWGDFFRWVGAAAASVVVWEWVERIELLEREEKKDGILGREVFEEDEMLNNSFSSKDTSVRRSGSSGDDGKKTSFANVFELVIQKAYGFVPLSTMRKHKSEDPPTTTQELAKDVTGQQAVTTHYNPSFSAPVSSGPTPSATPVSRTDTGTPSTIYAVHYHPIVDTPPPPGQKPCEAAQSSQDNIHHSNNGNPDNITSQRKSGTPIPLEQSSGSRSGSTARPSWPLAAHLFKRGKKSPPLEVKQAMYLHSQPDTQHSEETPRVILKRKIGRMAAALGGDRPATPRPDILGQPTVIPAPPRGHAWSPEIMRHSPVEHHGATTVLATQSTSLGTVEDIRQVQLTLNPSAYPDERSTFTNVTTDSSAPTPAFVPSGNSESRHIQTNGTQPSSTSPGERNSRPSVEAGPPV